MSANGTATRVLRGLSRRPAHLAGAAALAGSLVVALSTGVTAAGWNSAQIANAANDAGTGTLAITHAYQSTSCALGSAGSVQECLGSIAPTAPSPSSATDTITNTGSIGSDRLSGQVAMASCGVVQLSNARASGNPMLPRYGTGFRVPDPWHTSSAISLDGDRAYASSVTKTSRLDLLSGPTSLGVWFRADATSHGGALIGLSTAATDAAGSGADALLWMDSSGQLHFGIKGTLNLGLVSASGASTHGYNDDQWHLATFTLTPGVLGLTLVPQLYVDGVGVASGSALGLLTIDSGYWHLGWADLTGWDTTTEPHFDGRLSGGYVLAGTAQSAGTIGQLVDSTSASAYAGMLADAGQLWMLGDDGTSAGSTPAYAGSFPVIGTADPCAMINVSWTFTDPAATVTAGTSLAAFADGSYHGVPVAAPGTAQTSTITISRGSSYDSYVSGLHLYAPVSMRVTTDPAHAWSLTFAWSEAEAALLA